MDKSINGLTIMKNEVMMVLIISQKEDTMKNEKA
jgi:hypothetical protein